jgi:tetratricopeptide (TPR) repeat protein
MSVRWLAALVLVVISLEAKSLQRSREETDAKTKRGIELIYNLEFELAEQEFREIIRSQPKDPAGHFFLAMVTWWRIQSDITNEELDEAFLDSLNMVIDLCDELLDINDNDTHALFFKGGAIGFKGRLKFHRKDYLGAAAAGKDALPLVQDAIAADPKNYDVYLGTGIYNYYADVIPQEYPFLKPLLFFLPSGDKQKGLRQLQLCIEKGKYASIECTYFLLQIYHMYEKDYQRALLLALSLQTRFPNNPLFHRYLGRCYVSRGNWSMAFPTFSDIAVRARKQQRGYTVQAWREAEYYLGLHEMNNARYDSALVHFYACDEMSRPLDTGEASGFMVMANLRVGMIYDILGRRTPAEVQYRKVLDMKEYQDSHTQAEQYLYLASPFVLIR